MIDVEQLGAWSSADLRFLRRHRGMWGSVVMILADDMAPRLMLRVDVIGMLRAGDVALASGIRKRKVPKDYILALIICGGTTVLKSIHLRTVNL